MRDRLMNAHPYQCGCAQTVWAGEYEGMGRRALSFRAKIGLMLWVRVQFDAEDA